MRRLLKLAVKLLLITLAVVSLCGMTAEGYADEIADAVPPEASEILDGAGITPDNNGAASLEPQGVLGWLWEQCRDRLTEPVRLLAALCGIVLLCTLAKSFGDGSASMSGVFSAVGVLAGAGMTAAAVSDALTHTLNILQAASEFMLVFVPIYAGVIAVMGKAATAAAVNTVTLGAAQFFSQLAVVFLSPVCGTVMGLSVTGAIHPELNISRLAELIKKVSVWGLGLLMTVFMSILSAQTFVRNAADSVLIRTAKFAVSSGVPIVGGTISDASLSLLHSGIGTYGIIAVLVMILPPLITVALYRLALSVAEAFSSVFGIKELSELFKAAGWVMSIIMAVIVCFLLLNTISAVIMLAIGSGIA